MDVGRPTVMTEETLHKLKEAFIAGATDEQACIEANISPSTLYNYQSENPEFLEKKTLWKEDLKYRSKQNINKQIRTGDVSLSQWYLERRDKDFNPKQGIDHTSGGKPLPILNAVFPDIGNAENSETKEEN